MRDAFMLFYFWSRRKRRQSVRTAKSTPPACIHAGGVLFYSLFISRNLDAHSNNTSWLLTAGSSDAGST